jgi:hypothetical protein
VQTASAPQPQIYFDILTGRSVPVRRALKDVV